MDKIYELKFAIIAKLKASAAVTAFVGERIYDVPPENLPESAYPYIAMGDADGVDDSRDCADGLEITIQIDCYSYGSGEASSTAQVSKLADAVRRALRSGLDLPDDSDNMLTNFNHRTTRIIRARDGKTFQAAATFVANVEEETGE